MTRTARAAYPRAVIKDHHESRSGLNNAMRKSGAGQHNWGSLADERNLESQAIEDEELDLPEEAPTAGDSVQRTRSLSPPAKPTMARSNSAVSDNDIEEARKVRKNALKKVDNGDIDLAIIARSSRGVTGSPPPITPNKQTHTGSPTLP